MSDRHRSNAVFLHQADLDKLVASARQAAEFKEVAQRVQADFINYQDRVKREKEEWSRAAVGRFIRELLPALDSLADALRAAGGAAEADGLRILQKEFLRVLAVQGVAPIEAVGRPFDPNLHEAVGTVERADAEPGTVVEELRGGWSIQGRVLRPAMVKVARPAP
jgi:molecular chaperone GrpE